MRKDPWNREGYGGTELLFSAKTNTTMATLTEDRSQNRTLLRSVLAQRKREENRPLHFTQELNITIMTSLNPLKRNHMTSSRRLFAPKMDETQGISSATDPSMSQHTCAASCSSALALASASPSAKRRIVDPVFGVLDNPNVEQLISQKVRDLNNSGVLYFALGEYTSASTLFTEAVALRQQALLSRPQITATAATTAATTTSSAAGLTATLTQTATDLLDRLPINLATTSTSGSSGGGDSRTTTSSEPPATTYIYQRMEFDEGMNIYHSCESIQEHDHPLTVEATLYYNLAQTKLRLEHSHTAWRFFLRALDVLLPPGTSQAGTSARTVHCIVVPVLHNLGLLAYRKGNLLEAVSYYETALSHGSAIGGRQSICVGLALNCLGVIHYHLLTNNSNTAAGGGEGTNPMAAFHYFEEALRILSATLGPDTTAVATCLNNLGRVMVQRDDFVVALSYYKQALQIRRDRLGPDDLDYAATAFNAGQSFHQLGDYDKAIALYKEFLRVASLRFSSNHRDGTLDLFT